MTGFWGFINYIRHSFLCSSVDSKSEDGKTLYNELEVVEGMKLDRGCISPHFITNQKNQKCELEYPLVLIHEKKISNINSVIKVLELALKKERSLLIVADDVEKDAWATLIVNKLCAGIKVVSFLAAMEIIAKQFLGVFVYICSTDANSF